MRKYFIFFVFCFNLIGGQVNFSVSEMDSLILPMVSDTTFSGCVLIGDTQQVLFKKAYGYANFELEVPNNTNYIFNVASITKQFTGAGILLLSLQKKLSIDDTLYKYLPDFPNAKLITIKNLLSHRSGIQTYNDFPDYETFKLKHANLQEVVSWIKKSAVFSQPDNKFTYSNSNYGILAYIIEIVSYKSYPEFIRENFFIPAKMFNTGNFSRTEIVHGRVNNYEKSTNGLTVAPWFDYSFKYGSGTLQTSVEDMYKWFTALNQGIIYDSTFKQKYLTGDGINKGYGYGLGKNRVGFTQIAEHEGGIAGVSAFVVYTLEPSYFIMITSNVTAQKTRDSEKTILKYIYNKLNL
ncbi:MAG: serine hydrolase domain-containing protein [bacterium]